MQIKRAVSHELQSIAKDYPVITITGPRQAGKTTLARMEFPDYSYCNLENPEIRELAINDPNAFFEEFSSPVIIDEIQRVPQLLSYIQTIVDESEEKGMYILTGSHQFNLNQAITQSLAGRTALLNLLPFSIRELTDSGIKPDRDELIYKGFLPRIYKDDLNPTKTYRNYFQTYVERDLRQMVNIRNITQFEVFLKLLAGRVGQLLNLNSLSNDIGVSSNTLKEWMSILEASFLIFKLPPYFENFGKRVVKSPKIYFTDVGLATYLLGIEELNQVSRDPLIGNLFENMIVIEAVKSRYNQGLDPNLFFYRDNNRNEIDMIYKKSKKLIPIEIKYAKTIHSDFFKSLKKFNKITAKASRGYLIYSGNRFFKTENIEIKHFSKCYEIFD